MRAKRAKKYRKIMATYNLQFSFRTPYQTLCDSNFLRTCYSFKMPITKFLTNTLHGEARPYITQCTLAAVTEAHRKKAHKGPEQQKGRGDGRPEWLPLPEFVPLRYCKHKNETGEPIEVLSEVDCLLDLLRGQAQGNEVPKNRQHYILATAETEEEQQGKKRKRGVDLREQARLVPGVPIVYVKRSVMILEEPSVTSERLIRGVEKDKFKEGLIMNDRGLKRKREDGGEESATDDQDNIAREGGPKIRGSKRARGPNPLSVMKKKKPQPARQNGHASENKVEDGDPKKKKGKNRRLRGKKHKPGGSHPDSAVATEGPQGGDAV